MPSPGMPALSLTLAHDSSRDNLLSNAQQSVLEDIQNISNRTTTMQPHATSDPARSVHNFRQINLPNQLTRMSLLYTNIRGQIVAFQKEAAELFLLNYRNRHRNLPEGPEQL